MYRLPDSRTVPTVTVFDRPGFNNSQGSFISRYSQGPGRSSTTLVSGQTPQDHNNSFSTTTVDQLLPPRNALDTSRPYEGYQPAFAPQPYEPYDGHAPNHQTSGDAADEKAEAVDEAPPKKGWRFWVIFAAVNMATLLVAIDLSIIGTALPSIAADLNSGELYVWIGNAYVLSSSATQPMFGQAANIFGRRSLLIASIVMFLIGSAAAGAAKSNTVMIGARTVQGGGGGGIITVGEIIINDMLTLRERGLYTGLLAGTYAIGTVLGPVLGGVLTEHASWRWTFYINIPISVIALVVAIFFVKLKYKRVGTVYERIKRVDWIGNVVLIGAVTSILIAMTWGGTKYSWGAWQVTVPLELGLLGILAFAWIQCSGYVEEPTMPPRLFKNRTAVAIFLMAFFHGAILLWVIYFLPVYFQAIKGDSPTRAGVSVLPVATSIAPSAALSGFLVTKYGRYRRYQWAGWILMSIGVGFMAMLDVDTPTGGWVMIQLVFGVGNGFVYNTMISPLLAALPPSEIATATATWAFARAFGGIWGIAIPSAIFNGRIDSIVNIELAPLSAELAHELSGGGAFERATAAFVSNIPEPLRDTVIQVYTDGLKPVWYGSIAFAVIGIPLCAMVKRYELTNIFEDTGYGIKDVQPGRSKPANRVHDGWVAANSEANLPQQPQQFA